ncbi:MAG: circularly permuted type 2 ATP-grasp protein [Acidobacteria bacterium]|nr:circularly permuted type 2 ATP-grasp protein [Acidobacteriota bacterium]
MINEAITYYHSLLEKNGSTSLQAQADWLQEAMLAEKATFGGRILCPFLRPHFIAADQYAYIGRVVGSLMRSIGKLYQVASHSRKVRSELGLTSGEEALIKIDPGYRGFSVTSRIDSFLTGDSLQFVELNAETPAGIAYQDALAAIFKRLPLMKKFSRRYRVVPIEIRPRLLELLLAVYREFCRTTGRTRQAHPTIAIVDWKGLPTQTEFELFQAYFEKHGYRTVIAEPDELTYENGILRGGGETIELIYRRVLTSEFLARYGVNHPIIQAYKEHAVCIINPFRTKFAHKKMIFGLLSDERYEKHFTRSEKKIIDRHIPWTRRVCAGYSRYQGKRVDLCRFILDHRERLVLKPNDEYGGKGIFIGWESDAAAWEEALKVALENPYVVQKRVQVSYANFPIWADGRLTYEPMMVDMDPYIFHGKIVHGCLTRLSGSALCNVSSGGGQTPTFVIEKA